MDYSCFHSEDEKTKAQALHDESSLRHRGRRAGTEAEPPPKPIGAFPRHVIQAPRAMSHAFPELPQEISSGFLEN